MKIAAVCFYVGSIYWLSLRYPSFHTLFFPTLGSFSLVFSTLTFTKAKIYRIFLGAMVSSVLGTCLHVANPGVVSLFINTVVVIWLIRRYKWEAPAILAVSFIPFFSQATDLWTVPVTVFFSLLGLLLTVLLVEVVESMLARLPAYIGRKNISPDID